MKILTLFLKLFYKLLWYIVQLRKIIFRLIFLLTNKTQPRGFYLVSSRAFYHIKSSPSPHYYQSVFHGYPRIIFYKFWGPRPSSNEPAVSFHPDFTAYLYFKDCKIEKTFNLPLITPQYIKNRNKLTCIYRQPLFASSDEYHLSEEILCGLSYTQVHKALIINSFESHLAMLNVHISSISTYIDLPKSYISSITSCYEFLATNYSADLANINIQLFYDLCCTTYYSLSKGKDIGAYNLLFTDSSLKFIDWEPKELMYRPFWQDYLNLLLKTYPKSISLCLNRINDFLYSHNISAVTNVGTTELLNTLILATVTVNQISPSSIEPLLPHFHFQSPSPMNIFSAYNNSIKSV